MPVEDRPLKTKVESAPAAAGAAPPTPGTGMPLLYLSFAIVLSAAFWARPLIENETVQNRKAV